MIGDLGGLLNGLSSVGSVIVSYYQTFNAELFLVSLFFKQYNHSENKD